MDDPRRMRAALEAIIDCWEAGQRDRGHLLKDLDSCIADAKAVLTTTRSFRLIADNEPTYHPVVEANLIPGIGGWTNIHETDRSGDIARMTLGQMRALWQDERDSSPLLKGSMLGSFMRRFRELTGEYPIER